MKKIKFILFISFIAIYSCNNTKKEKEKIPVKAKQEVVEALKDTSPVVNEFKTKTGKIFIVKEEKLSASLSKITITPKGFEKRNETIQLKETDPLLKSFIADINNDGFDELYLITKGVGSGSYETIYGLSSNKDKSATPINIPIISEKSLKNQFKGYMGHDSIYISNNKLFRKYPVYKDGDANCCPTGGNKTIQYELIIGEASWALKIK